MATNNFDSGLEGELDIICNMIYVLLVEYDTVTEVIEEEDGFAEEMETHKNLCYYVMQDGSVNEDKVVFERPDMSMQQDLNPLYITAQIDGVGVVRPQF